MVSLWITTLTGFPIFRRGKAGPPHVLGVLTVVVLLVAALAGATGVFGGAAATVETVELLAHGAAADDPDRDRDPDPRAPEPALGASPDAPVFRVIYSLLFVLFLVGVTLQVRG